MNTNFLYDKLTGKCVREILFDGSPKNSIYLTFDDGPDAICTPKVLELLNHHKAMATFFIIGQKAKDQPQLIKEIITKGHSIGDHTIDHDTSQYFNNSDKISQWIENSSELIKSELKLNPVGFRSPLGIKTPALNKVLYNKKMPLVLWNIRFYDTKKGLTIKAVNKKLALIKNGSIILLHDTHKNHNLNTFLNSLNYLIVECHKRNFTFLPLTAELIGNSYREKYEAK